MTKKKTAQEIVWDKLKEVKRPKFRSLGVYVTERDVSDIIYCPQPSAKALVGKKDE